MTLILFEIPNSLDKFNTDQSKTQLLLSIQNSFEHLVAEHKNIFAFVRAAKEKADKVKVDFQDEQITLEMKLREKCEELGIKLSEANREFYNEYITDQSRVNKLKEIIDIASKIKELNP